MPQKPSFEVDFDVNRSEPPEDADNTNDSGEQPIRYSERPSYGPGLQIVPTSDVGKDETEEARRERIYNIIKNGTFEVPLHLPLPFGKREIGRA